MLAEFVMRPSAVVQQGVWMENQNSSKTDPCGTLSDYNNKIKTKPEMVLLLQ